MTGEQLFISLLHRLQDYQTGMVLHALIQQQADQTELKTSCSQLSLNLLGARVSLKQVQRALARLEDLGLVQSRSHTNYRTHITVDREAVQALLRVPVSDYLPGLRSDSFPFLDDLNAKATKSAPEVLMTGWPSPPLPVPAPVDPDEANPEPPAPIKHH